MLETHERQDRGGDLLAGGIVSGVDFYQDLSQKQGVFHFVR
jgi:hypothetical protein